MNNFVLIDDNETELNALKQQVEELSTANLHCFLNVLDAIKYIKTNPVDLIFTDVEMPKIDGISAIRSLKNPPKVVFVSAYPKFAVESFDLEPLHYLVKPVKTEKLLVALERFNTNASSSKQEDYIFILVDKIHIKLTFSEILYVKAEQNYVKITTPTKNHLILSNLSNFLKQLPANIFKRCHKSFAINTTQITSFDSDCIFINSEVVPVSNAYKELIFNELKNLSIKRNVK